MFTVHPIGRVYCPITEMSPGGWASVESEIHLEARYAGGLQGLEAFSHVIVLFFLDRAQDFDPETQLLRRPRGREDAPEVGVFAQRTKFRPNPLGVSAVRVLGIAGSVVRVRGLDALDGTPVLDIKPYMPLFDRVDDARMPPWVGPAMKGYF